MIDDPSPKKAEPLTETLGMFLPRFRGEWLLAGGSPEDRHIISGYIITQTIGFIW